MVQVIKQKDAFSMYLDCIDAAKFPQATGVYIKFSFGLTSTDSTEIQCRRGVHLSTRAEQGPATSTSSESGTTISHQCATETRESDLFLVRQWLADVNWVPLT